MCSRVLAVGLVATRPSLRGNLDSSLDELHRGRAAVEDDAALADKRLPSPGGEEVWDARTATTAWVADVLGGGNNLPPPGVVPRNIREGALERLEGVAALNERFPTLLGKRAVLELLNSEETERLERGVGETLERRLVVPPAARKLLANLPRPGRGFRLLHIFLQKL